MSVTIDQPSANQSFNRSQTVTISGTGTAPSEIKITDPNGGNHRGYKIKIDAMAMTWSTTAGPFSDHGGYTITAIGPGTRETTRGFTVSAP